MNLTNEIIIHIFKALKLINNSSFNNFLSLRDNKFLNNRKITYLIDDVEEDKNIWAVKIKYNESYLKLILADVTIDSPEYALICSIDETSYGLYYGHNKLLAVSLGLEQWVIADIYSQAIFLAGMEKIKNFQLEHSPYEINEVDYKNVASFIQLFENYETNKT